MSAPPEIFPCRPCCFQQDKWDAHLCEGNGCPCKGDHNIPMITGDEVKKTSHRKVVDVIRTL